jgi:predicted PurR-regulated permease PerM
MWKLGTNFQNKAINVFLTLLILLTIYSLLPFIQSIGGLISIVFYPFCIAGIFYYILRPVVNQLQKKMPKWLASLIALSLLTIFIGVMFIYIYPIVYGQINLLLKFNKESIPNQSLRDMIENFLIYLNSTLFNNIFDIMKLTMDFIVAIVTVPFILFYFLKDDSIIYNSTLDKVPGKYFGQLKSFLDDLDSTLYEFINGRILISLITSLGFLCCFIIIGLDYPILLFFTSLFFFIIPTIGCFLGAIPPLLIGFSMSSIMGIKVAIIMVVGSIIEGYLVTPKILEKGLYMHPLTVILILIISGSLFGILGIIISVPLYAVIRVLVKHLWVKNPTNVTTD